MHVFSVMIVQDLQLLEFQLPCASECEWRPARTPFPSKLRLSYCGQSVFDTLGHLNEFRSTARIIGIIRTTGVRYSATQLRGAVCLEEWPDLCRRPYRDWSRKTPDARHLNS